MPAEFSNETTLGLWATEADAAAEFDRRVELADCWYVEREVMGEYLQPKPMSDGRVCRIDRLLVPRQKLLDAGWRHGPVGIELEASRAKIAGPLSQAMDYTRAVWHRRSPPGFHQMLEWVFIWPWLGSKGNLQSIALQHRVGGVYFSKNTYLTFTDGSMNGLKCLYDGTLEVKAFTSGRRTGHRKSGN